MLDDYRAVLEALELREPELNCAKQSLRELTLSHSEPGMRVLYGVDVPTARALVRGSWPNGLEIACTLGALACKQRL